MDRDSIFPSLPRTLVQELLSEFDEIQANFYEGKWRASGLNAGRFCEVCFSIIANSGSKTFPDKASKPKDFIGSCKKLESDSGIPHGLRMTGSRVLTTLYEIRNNRDISHTGADVDPSFMDASLALANAKWLMAELIREFHDCDPKEAQSIVDNISQYTSPLVWSDNQLRRVLSNSLIFDEKLLILLASAGGETSRANLFEWLDTGTRKYFNSRVKKLHDERLIEAKGYGDQLRLLPPGNRRVATIASKMGLEV